MPSRWKKELDGGCESELRVRCMSDKWALGNIQICALDTFGTERTAHQIHVGQLGNRAEHQIQVGQKGHNRTESGGHVTNVGGMSEYPADALTSRGHKS